MISATVLVLVLRQSTVLQMHTSTAAAFSHPAPPTSCYPVGEQKFSRGAGATT